MRRATFVRFATSAVIFLAGLGCGHKGGSTGGGGDGGSGAGSSGGTLPDNAPNVSGSFSLGTPTTPAAGYEVWVFDQTAGGIQESPLDPDGSFVVPIGSFTEKHNYSLHLTKDFQFVGDIGISGTSPLATTVSYQGGFGFDLGQIIIPVDQLGRALGATGNLTGKLGGGFSAISGTDGSFSAYPVASYLGAVSIGSQLVVVDAESLLYSFYNRASNAQAYARDLRRLSRIGGLVTLGATTADAKVSAVSLTQAGSWLTSARLPGSDDATPESSPLWGANALSKVSSGRYEFSVYAGGMATPGMIGVFRIKPDAGSEPTVPRTVPRGVSFPPKVTAVSGSGGATSPVDYSAASTSNGLTLPFCKTGDVVLDLQPPLDDLGKPIAATVFDRVEAYFDYYDATSSTSAAVKVDGTKLASPYNAATQDTSITDLARAWDPAQLKLTFTLGPTVSALTTQELTIWSALVPTKIGAQTISLARIRLYYKSSTEATVGATAVWFKVGC